MRRCGLLFLLLFLLAILPPLLHAQPAIEWQRTYGGSGSDLAGAIVQTADGGYVLAGSTTSNDGDVSGLRSLDTADIWIVKTDASGAILWSKTYGGTQDDGANAIIQTSDGGYAVAGYTKSNDGDLTGNHGGYDVCVLKLSSSGAIEWSKLLGGSRDEKATSIVQTRDDGFALAAATRSDDGDVTFNHGGNDYWLIKLSALGNLQWQQTYGGSGDDEPSAIIQTSDSGYAMTGWTVSNDGDVQSTHGSIDAWIIKTDSLGNLAWQRTLGGSSEDAGTALIQTADHGFAMAGYTSSTDGDVSSLHGGWDDWLVKLSPTGTFDWEKTYGGSQYDEAWSITQAADGGFVLAGQTSSNDGDVTGFHGGVDFWVLKVASDGTLEWQKDMGGSATEEAFSIVQTSDYGYAVAGFSNSQNGDVQKNHGAEDFWLVKLAGSPPCAAIGVSIPNMSLEAYSGNTIGIAIVSSDTSARLVSSLDIAVGLKTDLLTPIYIDSTLGQFAGAQRTRFGYSGDSVSIRLELPTPILVTAGTLCVLQCKTFVTDTLSTRVVLKRVTFEDSVKSSNCLSSNILSSQDSGIVFSLTPQCGERAMSIVMGKSNAPIIDAISPNPSSGEITVRLHIPRGYQYDATLEVYDDLGNLLDRKPVQLVSQSESQSIGLALEGSSGVRYLRLQSTNCVSMRRLILER